ncbi:MAG: hypothetical protein ACPL7B_05320 [Candidatus Poribacteria bacterium]
MTIRTKLLIAIFVISTLAICNIYAVTTSVWEQSTYKDFSSGKPKNVVLSSKDQVMLSRALTPVNGNISELRIWCLAQDSQGNTYLGTGDKGKIIKITKDEQASLFFDSPETDIISIIIDKNDNIYAGSSPDGIIYKIEPNKVPTTFFKSEEKYIWSLAFDNSGNLYAGTGINGKIYKISPDGKGEMIYDSTETHIKCLLNYKNSIYAGGEGSGIIYKISDGKAFVIYDTSEKEISSLVIGSDGNLYASAVSGDGGQQQKDQEGQPPSGKAEQKAIIYQITDDGVATAIWESPSPIIFSMIPDGDKLLVGTGNDGNIYLVERNGEWSTISDCEESQIVALYRAKDTNEIWLTTGNPAKVYKLSNNYIKEGTIESKKYDTSVISKWGNISWDSELPANTSIVLSTRSGNTEKPDDTWSNWSEEYSDSSGTTITSPPARFIQWRAKLTSADGTITPILKRVSIAYLQKNLKPYFESVTIGSEQERPETQPRRPGADGSQTKTETVPMNGKKIIKWQAKDLNDDTLEYSVFFKGIDEQNWKLLKDELKTTSYQIDTESFPDGVYQIKVVASDSPSNPKDVALSEEEISDRFIIDNTPPIVLDLQANTSDNGKYIITGRAEDTTGYIKSMVYSIDGGSWKPMYPSDQVFDSKKETFSFPIDTLKTGEHTIVVKATDSAGNVGSAKTVIIAK